jgi:tetratricopeptide (TPR) repeat protein
MSVRDRLPEQTRPTTEIERTALMDRLACGSVRVLALWAAAGYGKSTLASRFAQGYDRAITIDLADARSCTDIARSIANVVTLAVIGAAEKMAAGDDAAAWLAYAQQVWRQPFDGVVILENAEAVAAVEGGEAFLAEILAGTPRPRTVVVASRKRLDLRLTRFAMPHEIYEFDERVLAFDVAETQKLLSSTPAAAHVVQGLTRGWPLCVRMILRLARESSLDAVVARVGSLDLDTLYDYLFEHIIATFDDAYRAAIVALAAIPRPTDADLELLFESAAGDLRRLALSGGLVTHRDDVYELHPLLRTSVNRRYHAEVLDTLQTAASRWLDTDPVRAALLYLEAGDFESAARAVEPHSLNFISAPPGFDFNTVLYRLPHEVVLRYPQLWSASRAYLGLSVSPDIRLAEALLVWDSLEPETPRAARLSVLSELLNALSNLGQHEEAQVYYDRYLVQAQPQDENTRIYRGIWGTALCGRQGRYEEARAHADDVLETLQAVPGFYAIVFSEAVVRRLRACGQWNEERLQQDVALGYARRSKNGLAIALSLIEGIFGAWFAGDRPRFNALLQELDDFRVPSIMPGTALFRNCAFGRLEDLRDGAERPQIRCYAYLIAGQSAPPAQRRSLIERAAAAADAANETILQVFTRVALAMVDPIDRDLYLERAMLYAERIDTRQVREAVAAMQRGELPKYFAAMAEQLLEGATQPNRYRLSIVDPMLHLGTKPISLTRREIELLCFLGIQDRAVGIDRIAEALVPDSGSSSANALLRVLITRVRKKCGSEIIASSRDGYRLGAEVEVSIKNVAKRIDAAQLRADLGPGEVAALRRDLLEVRQWMQTPMPPWEWGVEIDVRLRELASRLIATLRRESAFGRHSIDPDELRALDADARVPK